METLSQDVLCSSCKKTTSVAICYGCQRSFCTKHFLKHRSYLAEQMDELQKKYEHFKQDLHCDRFEQPLLSMVYAWERKSMRNIHEIAEKARDDLQKWMEKTKMKIQNSLEHMRKRFTSVEKSNNFTETDVHKWTKQLDELRNLLEKPSNISIVQEQTCSSTIHGIKIIEKPIEIINIDNSINPNLIEPIREHFITIFGPCKLSDNNHVVTHSSYRAGLSQISGTNEYSSGKHLIDFIIEKKSEKNIFFGIYSPSKHASSTFDSSIHGWWNLDYMIINGETIGGNNTEIFQTNDKLTLIIDCDQQQIELEHHRTKRFVHLPIKLNVCSFPWKILVRLLTGGDCIRIVSYRNVN